MKKVFGFSTWLTNFNLCYDNAAYNMFLKYCTWQIYAVAHKQLTPIPSMVSTVKSYALACN